MAYKKMCKFLRKDIKKNGKIGCGAYKKMCNFLRKDIKKYGKIGCGRPLNNSFDNFLPNNKLNAVRYKHIKPTNFVNNVGLYGFYRYDKNRYIHYQNIWFSYLKEINRYVEKDTAYNVLMENTNLCEDVIGVIIGDYI